MNWQYHHATFSIDESHPLIHQASAWTGHRAFAYDLVRFLKPKTITELGTHHGASFFSFCQAVKDVDLQSQCYAVDTWAGDPHAEFYGETVFQTVAQIASLHFPGIATLIRSIFDDAVQQFPDNSIDLLHIDGYHTREAVTHDYTTWLPKLAPHGVILFHDIVERAADFGVYLLWDELKKQYPSIEFHHWHGLGVLFPKGCNEKILHILDMEDELRSIYR